MKGTLDFGILYNTKGPDVLWVYYVDDRKPTFGYVLSLGTDAVTWTSEKQHAVTLSLTEAEYRGAEKGACEAGWLRRMLSDMQMQQTEPTPLFCANQGVIKLAKNPVFHKHTKHVNIHCHFIKQLVEDWSIGCSIVS